MTRYEFLTLIIAFFISLSLIFLDFIIVGTVFELHFFGVLFLLSRTIFFQK